MRKSQRVMLSIVLLMFALPAWKCSSSQRRSAIDNLDRASFAVTSLMDVTFQLHDSGVIDDTTATGWAKIERDALLAVEQARKTIAQTQGFDSASIASLRASFNEIKAALETLSAQGVLHLKSSNSKAKFDAFVQTAEVSVNALLDFANQIKEAK